MKKSNKILVCIFVIIILIISGYLGYKLGTEEEKKNKEYIINNNEKNIEELRKEGYNLILSQSKNIEYGLPLKDTELKIKENSITKDSIILELLSKRGEEYINVSTRYYILERKINGKWYQIEPIGIESKKYLERDTLGVPLNTNVKYNIFKDFSEYTKKGLPKGEYRIIFISQNIKENNSKSYIEKEFEIK
jgi:hypothetical protein